MDSAVQVVNMTSAVQVTAQEVNDRFHGRIPKSIRFYCPFCTRPVNPGAMGHRFDAKRRNIQPGRRKTKDPYFSHRKNDEWSKSCEAYHAGMGTVPEEMALPLLMFLRRMPGAHQFRVEVALRRRGLAFMLSKLSPDDTIIVDDQSYRLKDMLANRRSTIPLPNPLYRTDIRIQVPQCWQKNIGCVPKTTSIMLFTDSFGANGGRLLPNHSALRTDRTYYLVAYKDRVHDVQSLFSRMDSVGQVTGNDRLRVYAICVSSTSLFKNKIDDWLSQYGYCLSDIDRSAQLMWPPSLSSWGVDEPLFRHSLPVYRFPYLSNARQMQDRIMRKYFLPSDSRARGVGLIGFGNRFEGESETESYCVFFKPKPRMPWNTVYLGPRYPDDMHPYDEWTTAVSADEVIDNGAASQQLADVSSSVINHPSSRMSDCTLQMSLNRGVDIALQRQGLINRQSSSRGIAIAQLRGRNE